MVDGLQGEQGIKYLPEAILQIYESSFATVNNLLLNQTASSSKQVQVGGASSRWDGVSCNQPPASHSAGGHSPCQLTHISSTV